MIFNFKQSILLDAMISKKTEENGEVYAENKLVSSRMKEKWKVILRITMEMSPNLEKEIFVWIKMFYIEMYFLIMLNGYQQK